MNEEMIMSEEDWGVTCCLLDEAFSMVGRLDALWANIIFDIDKQLSAKSTECIEQDWGLDPEVGYGEGCLDEGIYY